MADLTHGLSGSAGEYYVAAELSRLGFIATLTNRSSEGIDILAAKPRSGKAIKIQVKTTQGAKPRWLMNEKHEKDLGKNFFYVFVKLKAHGARPDFYVVSSKRVASEVFYSHRKLLASAKKDGTKRRDTGMRAFNDDDGIHKEKWRVLEGK